MLNEEAKQCIKTSLDAVAEYKKYRDTIIHSLIFDAKAGIAQYIATKAKAYQVMMTIDALKGLYERLVILKDELREIDILFRIANNDERFVVMNPQTHLPEIDKPKALREQAVPAQTARAMVFQNKRKSLLPLPEFPDAHLILQGMTNIESH